MVAYADAPGIADLEADVVAAVNITGSAPIVPYDHSDLAIVIDAPRLQALAPSVYALLTGTNFSFVNLLQHAADVAPLLVVPSPLTSGAGINFFMWTIAVLGDSHVGLNGSNPDRPDWRPLWSALVQHGADIKTSWGDAFAVFQDISAKRPIVFSYSTDPAYDLCFNGNTSYRAVFSNDNGIARSWQSIEGVGITTYANASGHLTLAKTFVDYVLNATFQSNLALNNWVYPARQNITLPNCYAVSGVNNSVLSVNSFLSPSTIQANAQTWQADMSAILDSSDASARATPRVLLAVLAVAVTVALAGLGIGTF